jgi:superfamily I DNA/RNA helicase
MCCSGWRTSTPRFLKLVGEGCRIFGEALNTDDDRLDFKRRLLTLLLARRDGSIGLHDWLRDIQEGLIAGFIAASRTLDDEGAILTDFLTRMGEDEDIGAMTLGQFTGDGDGNDRINLSTLHSAKGREFSVVVLFGMDASRIPRNNATPTERRESRRLFYVGFTRPEEELHVLYTGARPSPFVLEVQQRMDGEDPA